MMQHFEHNGWEGQKPVKKDKYQWLNRFRSSNHDVNPEDDLSMHGTEEGDTTLMQRKKIWTSHQQQRQNLQAQQRPTNAMAGVKTENTNDSMKLASDFTYKAPQVPSAAT